MRTKGWRNVFSFTFLQYIKTKSFIVGNIIICVIVAAICVLTNILPVALNGGDSSSESEGGGSGETVSFFTAGELAVFDEAGILAKEDTAALTELFGDRCTEPDSLETTVEELKTTDSMKIAAQITTRTDKDGKTLGYEVRSYYSSAAKGSVDELNAMIQELVNRRIMLNAGVAPENYQQTKYDVITAKTEAGGKNLNSLQGMINYALPMLVSIVLFMFIFAYGQVVAQSIATEKTSRVMELLLTSVRPLAVVIGKVLAMGLVSFLQFFLMIGVGAASFAVSSPFGWISKAAELLKDPDIQAALSQAGQSGMIGSAAGVSSSDFEIAQTMNEFTKTFTPFNIIMIIVIFVLGFLFFSLVAALIGASVSRMEDLQAAMGPYSIIGVLGMYLAYFPVIFNADALAAGDGSVNGVQLFSYYCPISSPFALPGAVIVGTISPTNVLISVLVLAAFVALIAVVVSKVYEAIILHNGNRIKFGDILKMAVRK